MKRKEREIETRVNTERSLQNQTVIKTAVQLSGLRFPEDVHGAAKPVAVERNQRTESMLLSV